MEFVLLLYSQNRLGEILLRKLMKNMNLEVNRLKDYSTQATVNVFTVQSIQVF